MHKIPVAFGMKAECWRHQKKLLQLEASMTGRGLVTVRGRLFAPAAGGAAAAAAGGGAAAAAAVDGAAASSQGGYLCLL